ncbi:MAG TPA: MBL fold metallo-hydrolase [Lacunisphaera sp.]|nr:MBL fold metallo-hydrolase [Lacunisphaera sp.]
MIPRTPLIGSLLSFLMVASASAQQDFSKVEIKATQVSGNVYMLEGSGGNIGVSVGPDGILIVDDQFAPLADKITAALQQLNPGKLKYVVNTHHHGDHTGGNATFGAREATIVAQANVRANLGKDPKTPPAALPAITFDRGATVYFNGEEISATHYGPAHTNGDSVIRFRNANVMHLGDQLMTDRFPYIDFSNGGDLDGLIANWKVIIASAPADVKIIPGHGRLATLDDLKAALAVVEESAALIRKGMAEGKTLEQLKAEGLPEKFKSWGSGFINPHRWIETVYNQAHKNPPKT